MRKFTHPSQSAPREAATGSPEASLSQDDAAPSKTRRKAEMHALQHLGEALVGLSLPRLASLALPERLADAITEARTITRWEARRRQMQFIGRLMRDVDPNPIQARLDQWAGAPNEEKARMANVERWRIRLMSDAGALDLFCAENRAADRPRLEALLSRARAERAGMQPPHAYRELFRMLNELLAAP